MRFFVAVAALVGAVSAAAPPPASSSSVVPASLSSLAAPAGSSGVAASSLIGGGAPASSSAAAPVPKFSAPGNATNPSSSAMMGTAGGLKPQNTGGSGSMSSSDAPNAAQTAAPVIGGVLAIAGLLAAL